MKVTIQLNFLPEVLKNFDVENFNDGQYGPLRSRSVAKSRDDHWSFVNCVGETWGASSWEGYVGKMGSDIQWTTCRGNAVRVQRNTASSAYLTLDGTRGGCLAALQQLLTPEEVEIAKNSHVVNYQTSDARLLWYQFARDVPMPPEMAVRFVRDGKNISADWIEKIQICDGKTAAWVSASFDPATLKVVLAHKKYEEKEAARMADYSS